MRKRMKVIVALTAICLLVLGSLQLSAADFSGKTVAITFWGDLSGEFKEGGRAEGRIEEAEEKFNCQVEFLPTGWSDYMDTLMTRLLAGDSQNDIWMTQQRQFWQLVSQNAYYPLSRILSPDYYENLPGLPRAVNESLTYKGATYGYGIDFGVLNPISVTAWNKDIFEREGLPDIYELYENGEWTWAKMTEIAIEATRDTDGDGEIDQWGLGTSVGPQRMAIKFGLANDARVSKFNENGQRVFSFDSKNALAAIDQVYEWRNVHNVAGGSWQAFIDGKVAIIADIGIYMLNRINPNMEDDFGVVPFPMGPDATQHRYPAEAVRTFVLPANVDDPEGLVELTHFFWPRDEYEENLEMFVEGKVRDRKAAEVLMKAHNNWSGEVFDLEFVFGWGNTPFMQAMGAAVNGEKGPAAAMEEVKPEIQAILEEMFNE